MKVYDRRWPIAFLLALGVHAALFRYGGMWYGMGNKAEVPRLAPGFETLNLTLVDEPEPPPPAPPPAPPPPVVSPPVVKPPEPMKEPEPVPVPEPKPVLTAPEPAAPAPVAVKPAPPPPVAAAPRPAPVAATPPAPAATAAPPSTAPVAASNGTGQPGGAPPAGQPGGPAPLDTIHPRYPMGSRVRGEEGVVSLCARVDERGHPVEVEVTRSSGYAALDAAAERAVKGAQFVPPRRGAPPESYVANLSIRFRLKD